MLDVKSTSFVFVIGIKNYFVRKQIFTVSEIQSIPRAWCFLFDQGYSQNVNFILFTNFIYLKTNIWQ